MIDSTVQDKEDYGAAEIHRAILNILEDGLEERALLEDTQRAMLNILEDVSDDKELMEDSQKAMLNILEDVSDDKELMEDSQKAMLNILEDVSDDKELMEDSQKAMLNILEDYGEDKEAIEQINIELEDAKQGLESRVSERTEELQAINKELESFSYSVSHDLRAPLRAIVGYSQILLREYSPKLDTEGQRMLKILVRNAKQMGNLIDDILEFSRLGRQGVTAGVVDLRSMFESHVKQLTDDREGEIDITIGNLGKCVGDRLMLGQLVNNFLSNAIKYSQTRDKVVIEVGGLEPKDGFVTYFVKDNGVGFDQRFANKNFGVFERLHTSTEFEGTGVGMAIAARVVSNHGGSIWAEGEVDKGATFFFTLPFDR